MASSSCALTAELGHSSPQRFELEDIAKGGTDGRTEIKTVLTSIKFVTVLAFSSKLFTPSVLRVKTALPTPS
jgi:hypothetical protein